MDDNGTLVASTYDLELCNGGYRFLSQVPLYLGQGIAKDQYGKPEVNSSNTTRLERQGAVVGNLKFSIELLPPGSYLPAQLPSSVLPMGTIAGGQGVVMLHADPAFVSPDLLSGGAERNNRDTSQMTEEGKRALDAARAYGGGIAGIGENTNRVDYSIEYEINVQEPVDELDEFRCAECIDGFIDCPLCKAHGFLVCELCNGEGISVCPNCADRGYTFCEVAGITRHTVLSEIDPAEDSEAHQMARAGQKIALRQHFAANVSVKSARKECELCWGESYGCPSCIGLGKIRCPKCAGTKETHCPFCLGDPGMGRVVS